jgi:hypothetical protein
LLQQRLLLKHAIRPIDLVALTPLAATQTATLTGTAVAPLKSLQT